jgi:hypothetical protein
MIELKAFPWYEKINVRALDDDVRRNILEIVKERLGCNKAVEVLDVSKGWSMGKVLVVLWLWGFW